MKRNFYRLKKNVNKNSASAEQDLNQENSIEDIRPIGSSKPVEICQPLTENTEIVNDTLGSESILLEPENSEHFPFEFTPGARMGSTLLYSIKEKQLYRCNKEFSNYKRYVCIVKACRAALYLRENELSKSPSFKGHNHPDQEAVAAKNRFEATCKAKCLEGDTDPSLVFTSTLSE